MKEGSRKYFIYQMRHCLERDNKVFDTLLKDMPDSELKSLIRVCRHENEFFMEKTEKIVATADETT